MTYREKKLTYLTRFKMDHRKLKMNTYKINNNENNIIVIPMGVSDVCYF